ncbi:MAG: lipocalin family protein [Bacteroidales bacterium]|nr:lipocalin family protein [Bacteroidales bacterium]
MKKLSNLLSASLLLILSLGVMSCSKDKDDDDVELSAASLVGIWDLTKSEYYIDGEKNDNILRIEDLIDDDGSIIHVTTISTYMEYASDGTATTYYNEIIKGQEKTSEIKQKFEVSGNEITLTLIDGTGEEVNEVLSFDGKTMKAKSGNEHMYIVTTWTKR